MVFRQIRVRIFHVKLNTLKSIKFVKSYVSTEIVRATLHIDILITLLYTVLSDQLAKRILLISLLGGFRKTFRYPYRVKSKLIHRLNVIYQDRFTFYDR